ncbi:hypothetical protein C4D60_Mb08t21660 [Musa balbisiana]|uniref:Uncharacterized protein n=1 Tax=Musa balbisiana TaxID=52838 RepID=A0A4S8K5G7_MUSBA|nr:hypothetical protein C4D60_Mb08t21660 [Musa balbisiana]
MVRIGDYAFDEQAVDGSFATLRPPGRRKVGGNGEETARRPPEAGIATCGPRQDGVRVALFVLWLGQKVGATCRQEMELLESAFDRHVASSGIKLRMYTCLSLDSSCNDYSQRA